MMLSLPADIYVALEPIDLRLSFDRLAGLVRDLGAEPRLAARPVLYVFHNRRQTHLKLLWHDRFGYCILYKRADRGGFRIPAAVPSGARQVQVPMNELRVLFEGVDRSLLRKARRVAKRRRAERGRS